MKVPQDKILHAIAGIVVCFVISLIAKNPMYGLVGAVIAGIAKEAWDYYDYGKVDFLDCLATWIGGIAGYIVALLIHTL